MELKDIKIIIKPKIEFSARQLKTVDILYKEYTENNYKPLPFSIKKVLNAQKINEEDLFQYLVENIEKYDFRKILTNTILLGNVKQAEYLFKIRKEFKCDFNISFALRMVLFNNDIDMLNVILDNENNLEINRVLKKYKLSILKKSNIETIKILYSKKLLLPEYYDILNASFGNQFETVNFLLNNKDMIFKDSSGESVIKQAILFNNTEMVKLLFEDKRYDYRENRHILLKAVENGNLEIVKLIKENDFFIFKENLNIIMEKAAEKGHYDVLKFLLEYKKDLKGNPDSLEYAAYYGHINIVDLLLTDETPFIESLNFTLKGAFEKGYINIVKCILEHETLSKYKQKLIDLLSEEKLELYTKSINIYEKLLNGNKKHSDILSNDDYGFLMSNHIKGIINIITKFQLPSPEGLGLSFGLRFRI